MNTINIISLHKNIQNNTNISLKEKKVIYFLILVASGSVTYNQITINFHGLVIYIAESTFLFVHAILQSPNQNIYIFYFIDSNFLQIRYRIQKPTSQPIEFEK